MLRIFLIALILTGSTRIRPVDSHNESGGWTCEADPETRISAEFRPGLVTIDGHADDWNDVDGTRFSLLPALDPDADKEYPGGKISVKALHDGKDVSFMLEVDGDYAYTKGDSKKCPSISLMFQVGESASYHNMGGCEESSDTCNSTNCRGHEVDIVHFSLGSAIPGRLYGGNPLDNRDGTGGDRFGHLVDLYAWNPHCRNLDGVSRSGNETSAQNNWKGAWWHSSLTTHTGFIEEDSPYASSGNQKGTYYFELSRPLRTMDRLQQDVQFTIGQTSKFAVAFWYPPWNGWNHYSISCDWVPLDISAGVSSGVQASSKNSWDAASALSLILSAVSIGMSVFVMYLLKKTDAVKFTPINNL